MTIWNEAMTLPEDPKNLGSPLNVSDGVLNAAWADLVTKLTAAGWRFCSADVGGNAVKFGGRIRTRYGVSRALHDLILSEHGLREAFHVDLATLGSGIVVVRALPRVVEQEDRPGDRSQIRARLGWVRGPDEFEEIFA